LTVRRFADIMAKKGQKAMISLFFSLCYYLFIWPFVILIKLAVWPFKLMLQLAILPFRLLDRLISAPGRLLFPNSRARGRNSDTTDDFLDWVEEYESLTDDDW